MPFSHVSRITPGTPSPGPGGWSPCPLFHRPTPVVADLSCHYSVLAPGRTPHPPHAHVEEEILLVLDGQAEILLADSPDDPAPRVVPMTRGQFSYYPAWQHHTLRNASQSDVTYLMFKWSDAARRGPLRRAMRALRRSGPEMSAQTFDLRDALAQGAATDFDPRLVFEGATEWLGRLHCHLTRLKPGGGYAAHADAHDVALVLLEGAFATNGQHLAAPGLAFFERGTPHDMHNPGTGTARYLVFEFHR